MNTINEQNGQTVKGFGDLLALLLDEDSGLDIERAIIAMAPTKARVLEKQISALYKKLFDLTNQGFGLREGNSVRKDQNDIRHFAGSVKQFKDMFDDLADGEDTNAYDSPVRQGYDIHPTREEDIDSPHWDKDHEDEKTQNENHIPTFNTFLNEARTTDGLGKDAMKIFGDLEGLVGFEKGDTITNYNKINPAIKDHKLFKKITPNDMRILGNALGNLMRIAIRMER